MNEQKSMMQRYLTRGDLVVISLVLALGLGSAFYLWGGGSGEGEATHVVVRSLDREKTEPLLQVELPAEERHEIEGGSGYLFVKISGYRARVTEADCPDQICVHTGWLTRPGNRSICVPRQIVVELVGDEEEFDEIVR